MSLFVLSPDTVWNPGVLSFSTAPRKILQRGLIFPKGDRRWGARAILESQALRFLVTLTPFMAAGLIWPNLALPLGSAPIFMLMAIGFVEMRLLRLSKAKRATITTEAEAARALDTLNFRGRRILTELAALKGVTSGTLHLVVEQSDMARIPPLTIASLQADEGKSRLVPLSAQERAVIHDGLFDADFTERHLFEANQRDNVFFRSVSFDVRGVSAHARLAAFLDSTPAPEEAPA